MANTVRRCALSLDIEDIEYFVADAGCRRQRDRSRKLRIQPLETKVEWHRIFLWHLLSYIYDISSLVACFQSHIFNFSFIYLFLD